MQVGRYRHSTRARKGPAGHGHVETVQLLKRGVNVDAVFTADGKTVPQWLEQFPGHPELAKIRALLD